ncbi:MAG: ribosome recycling factor [Candidatus Gracilibacteria bacterium]|jgi:ribosome recycling factor
MLTDPVIAIAVAEFEKVLNHLKEEFSRLQVGRANAALVEHVMVEAYGSVQPLKNVASISVPDAKTIQIQPWDRSILSAVEKAIQVSDLGLNPVNRGIAILLNIPALTEERRRDLVKVVNTLAENTRISVRNIRQTAHSKFKEMKQNKQISEDEETGAQKQLQTKVDEANAKIMEMAKAKEEGVMTV